jgi:hypothetical protein
MQSQKEAKAEKEKKKNFLSNFLAKRLAKFKTKPSNDPKAEREGTNQRDRFIIFDELIGECVSKILTDWLMFFWRLFRLRIHTSVGICGLSLEQMLQNQKERTNVPLCIKLCVDFIAQHGTTPLSNNAHNLSALRHVRRDTIGR